MDIDISKESGYHIKITENAEHNIRKREQKKQKCQTTKGQKTGGKKTQTAGKTRQVT